MRSLLRTVLLATLAGAIGGTGSLQAATKTAVKSTAPAQKPSSHKKSAAPASHSSAASSKSHHAASSKTTGSKTTAKTSAKTATRTSSAPASTASASKGGKRATTSRYAKAPAAVPFWKTYQQQPTPDRFREIQQAMAQQGYATGDPDGNWNADWMAALKRYQAEKNLPGEGKLNSLTLISLGLGPKRATPEEPSKPNANIPSQP